MMRQRPSSAEHLEVRWLLQPRKRNKWVDWWRLRMVNLWHREKKADKSGLTSPSPANGTSMLFLWSNIRWKFPLIFLIKNVNREDLRPPLLKTPPRRGPAIAEQLHVTLSAWDHIARCLTSTISAVMTHTELTIPPPPIPARARAAISHSIVYIGLSVLIAVKSWD